MTITIPLPCFDPATVSPFTWFVVYAIVALTVNFLLDLWFGENPWGMPPDEAPPHALAAVLWPLTFVVLALGGVGLLAAKFFVAQRKLAMRVRKWAGVEEKLPPSNREYY